MDHFAAFGEIPRPWIDPDSLKKRFLALSAEAHPDKFADPAEKAEAEKRFAELNKSYEVLRHTRTRLLHFLELRGHPRPTHVQSVPPEAMEFFSAVAEQTRKADELLKEKDHAASPMLKVRFFEKALQATSDLQNLQTVLRQRIEAIEATLRAREARLEALANAAAALGFLERWSAQLQQRLAALAF
jgi:DnaJ-domain-containing protein 1